MRKFAVAAVGSAALVLAIGVPAGAKAPDKMDIKAGVASGFVKVHGAKAGNARRQSNPNMTWHGGAIMPSSTIDAIYWGTSWPNASFAGDKISGLDTWYGGFGGSAYAAASNEYTGTNGRVSSATSYGTHFVDPSAAPSGQPSVSTIVSEVGKVLTQQGVTPPADGSGYYPVYVDQPRGHAGFCAWHSYGSINGINVQVAFFFNLDNDPGCDPGDTKTSHSEGLAALANVSAHELSEARTDPRNGGWWDASGDENGDKCAWAFPQAAYTTVGGQLWLMQGEWSNQAYSDGTGLANLSGQKGCIFAAAK